VVRIKGVHDFKVLNDYDDVVVFFTDEEQNEYSMDIAQEDVDQLTDELLDIT
jgi:hypothetical protein